MWKDAYLESRVLSADPTELIAMLYERALELIQTARRDLAANDIAGRSKAIGRAIAVLSELQGSLDHSVGGALSQNLADLYEYMRSRLTTANVHQQDWPLAEVEELLQTLSEAWNAVVESHRQPVAAARTWEPAFAAPQDAGCAASGWSA